MIHGGETRSTVFLIVTIIHIPARNVTAITRGAGNRNEIVIQLNTDLTIIVEDCRIVCGRRVSRSPSSNDPREAILRVNGNHELRAELSFRVLLLAIPTPEYYVKNREAEREEPRKRRATARRRELGTISLGDST